MSHIHRKQRGAAARAATCSLALQRPRILLRTMNRKAKAMAVLVAQRAAHANLRCRLPAAEQVDGVAHRSNSSSTAARHCGEVKTVAAGLYHEYLLRCQALHTLQHGVNV